MLPPASTKLPFDAPLTCTSRMPLPAVAAPRPPALLTCTVVVPLLAPLTISRSEAELLSPSTVSSFSTLPVAPL